MFILNEKKCDASLAPSEEVCTDLHDLDVIGRPCGILAVLCRWLEEQQSHEFVIVTSEKIYRPLMSRDFLIFLEQLPDVNAAVNNGHVSEFYVGFFEQGFELRINCRKKDGLVLVDCIEDYWNTAKEIGATQRFSLDEFAKILHQVARSFVRIALAAYPELQHITAFMDWCYRSGCELKVIG